MTDHQRQVLKWSATLLSPTASPYEKQLAATNLSLAVGHLSDRLDAVEEQLSRLLILAPEKPKSLALVPEYHPNPKSEL